MSAHDKVAIVTGAARGIGAAIAARFAQSGYRVMACGRHARPAGLDASIGWQVADVSVEADVQRLMEETLATYGRLDVLVNNAGVQPAGRLVDATDAYWDAVMGTNALGVFRCSRAAIRHMRGAGGGVILNIGSTSGLQADAGLALYNASKGFVHALTRSISVDHGADGIRCNAICPGWIETGMTDDAFAAARDPAAARRDALARHAVGRLGQPSDIAATAVWLASPEAAFVSGQTFVIDGGLLAGSPIRPDLY
mgnify:CR=1 FL=1